MEQNKRFLVYLAAFTGGFVILCGGLVLQTGLFKPAGSDELILLQNVSAGDKQAPAANSSIEKKPEEQKSQYWAVGSRPEKVIIGAADPNTEDPDKGFRLQLQLSCFGASIEKATFSDGNGRGFNDRNPKRPRPLVLLSPTRSADGSTVLSMANQSLVLVEQGEQLSLDKFAWQLLGTKINSDGSQSVTFQTEINYAEIEKILILSKTYTIYPRSYLIDCNLAIENVSIKDQKVSFALCGPVGIKIEDKRTDDRKAVGGFEDAKGVINAAVKPIANIKKAKTEADNQFVKNADNFLWAAIVNKYFAAIVVPVPDEGKKFCQWIRQQRDHILRPGQKK